MGLHSSLLLPVRHLHRGELDRIMDEIEAIKARKGR
jgi:hypothetical protein